MAEARPAAALRAGRRRGVPGPAAGQRGAGPAPPRHRPADVLAALRPGASRATCSSCPGGKSGGRVAVLSTPRRRGRRPAAAGHHRRPAGAVAAARGLPGAARARWPRSSCPTPYAPEQRRLPAPGGRRRCRRPGCGRTAWSGCTGPAGVAGGGARRHGRGRRRRPPTRWPAAPTLDRHLRAAERAERLAPRRRAAGAAHPGPHRVAGPPVRPGAAGARGVGLRRRLGARPPPGERLARHLPRVRPAGRRVPAARACSTTSSPPSWPAWRRCSPTRPGATASGAGAWFPSAELPSSAGRRSSGWRPSSTRAEEEAGLPLTRPPDAGFVALAHAWAAGERPRRRHRRRGALGRRLRPQRQAADRPAAPARRRGARPGHRPRRPARRPTRCSAAWWRPRRCVGGGERLSGSRP